MVCDGVQAEQRRKQQIREEEMKRQKEKQEAAEREQENTRRVSTCTYVTCVGTNSLRCSSLCSVARILSCPCIESAAILATGVPSVGVCPNELVCHSMIFMHFPRMVISIRLIRLILVLLAGTAEGSGGGVC